MLRLFSGLLSTFGWRRTSQRLTGASLRGSSSMAIGRFAYEFHINSVCVLPCVSPHRTSMCLLCRPMYCSENYPGDFSVAEGMQRSFEDLLYKYKVDLALYGHYHSYERSVRLLVVCCCCVRALSSVLLLLSSLRVGRVLCTRTNVFPVRPCTS